MQFTAILALITKILAIIGLIPKDAQDTLIDAVEQNNVGNKYVMVACTVVRAIIDCPDDDVDQSTPI